MIMHPDWQIVAKNNGAVFDGMIVGKWEGESMEIQVEGERNMQRCVGNIEEHKLQQSGFEFSIQKCSSSSTVAEA